MAAIGSDTIPIYIDSNGCPQPTKEFALKSHKHTKSDITDFAHKHVIDDVTDLQSALDLKAPLASPTFTGTPKTPTPTDSSDEKMVVNKEYLLDKIGGVVTLSLKDVYPVGSVYITMNADVPEAFRVGMTWVKLTEGRCLWNATNDQLGADLPEILKVADHTHFVAGAKQNALKFDGTTAVSQVSNIASGNMDYQLFGSNDTPTLGKTSGIVDSKSSSDHLRPASIGVAMFKRTA